MLSIGCHKIGNFTSEMQRNIIPRSYEKGMNRDHKRLKTAANTKATNEKKAEHAQIATVHGFR